MPFWNPKSYNPNMGQFGMNMIQQGMGQQSMGPAQGLANMLQMILGGAISGGQNKARKRAEGETEEQLSLAQAMQQNVAPTFGSGPSAFGMPKVSGAVAEAPQALAKRKQDKVIQTLLKSEIPEYRQQGQSMLIKSLAFKTPEYDFRVVGKNLVRVDKTSGEVAPVFKEPGKPYDVTNWNPEHNAIITGPDGQSTFVKGAEPPKEAKPPRVHHDTKRVIGPDGLIREVAVVRKEDPPGSGNFVEVPVTGAEASIVADQTFSDVIPVDQVTDRKIQEKLRVQDINLGKLDRIGDLIKEMDPTDHLGLKGFVTGAVARGTDWIAPGFLSKNQKEWLSSNSEFRTRVREYGNEYIRSVTGAVMNANEIGRIMGALIHPALGANEFAGRLDALHSMAQEADTRYRRYIMESHGNDEEAQKKVADWLWSMYGGSEETPSWRMDGSSASGSYGGGSSVTPTPTATPLPATELKDFIVTDQG